METQQHTKQTFDTDGDGVVMSLSHKRRRLMKMAISLHKAKQQQWKLIGMKMDPDGLYFFSWSASAEYDADGNMTSFTETYESDWDGDGVVDDIHSQIQQCIPTMQMET